MILKRLIVFAFLVCLILGCKKHKDIVSEDEVIRINPNQAREVVNLSEIVDSVKYIKLETGPGYLMGRILRIIIKEKYIYALDLSRQSIYVFDKEGKYVSVLDKQGKGPDEYLRLGPIIIDNNEEFIKIYTSSGEGNVFLKYSNISFNLIEKISMPRVYANSVRNEGDLYYFATQQIENIVDGKSTNADILVVNNGEIAKCLFNKTITTRGSGFSPNVESFTKNNEGKLFVSIMYNNTFYELDKMNANPFITIDFGRDGIDNSIGNEPLDKQLEYLKSITGLAAFPVLNINNADIMAFSYYFAEDNNSKLFQKNPGLHQYLIFKKSNKTIHTKSIKNDITGFPEEIYFTTYYHNIAHEAWYKNYLVDIVNPASYLSKKNKTQKYVEGLGEISINDNPIIILIKLKEL